MIRGAAGSLSVFPWRQTDISARLSVVLWTFGHYCVSLVQSGSACWTTFTFILLQDNESPSYLTNQTWSPFCQRLTVSAARFDISNRICNKICNRVAGSSPKRGNFVAFKIYARPAQLSSTFHEEEDARCLYRQSGNLLNPACPVPRNEVETVLGRLLKPRGGSVWRTTADWGNRPAAARIYPNSRVWLCWRQVCSHLTDQCI